jgi:hypothetical protein
MTLPCASGDRLVHRLVEEAKARYPELATRLDAALRLYLTGAVQVRNAHTAIVAAQVVAHHQCRCAEAQYDAPSGLCRHRLAVGLVRRLQTEQDRS